MSDVKHQLDAIADAAPPPGDLRREHEIRRALDEGLASPALAARRIWPWATLGGFAVAAAAIVFWLSIRPHGLVVEKGSLAPPPVAMLVETHDLVVLRTPDDSTVEAITATRFARMDDAATRWQLERGHLEAHVTKRVPGTTFEIVTPEVAVAVVGTRFSVERVVVGGVGSTRVHVDEGVVRVEPVTGDVVMLHAGDTWPSVQTATNDVSRPHGAGSATGDQPHDDTTTPTDASSDNAPTSPDAATSDAPMHSTDPTLPTKNDAAKNDAAKSDAAKSDAAKNDLTTTGRPFDASAIRRVIRAGNLADARKAIDDGRKLASAKRDLAELGVLAAEAELAGRATKKAIDLYLAVVRDYPTTAQAEQALFAAAQLAARQPDAGYKADAILRDYLDAYPKGQFASDAQRLLDGAKK